jgi:hypothetical protein
LRLWFQILSFLLHQNNEEKMKKNLLTFMFVVALLGVGVSAVSAKTDVSSGNSATVSKKPSAAKVISNKINALKAKCTAGPCADELYDLIDANANYLILCSGTGFPVGCGGLAEIYLLQTAEAFEMCIQIYGGNSSKHTDKKMDRSRMQESKV